MAVDVSLPQSGSPDVAIGRLQVEIEVGVLLVKAGECGGEPIFGEGLR